MSSLQSAKRAAGTTASSLPVRDTGLTVRLALDDQTRHDAYAIRHASYLSGGFIDRMPGAVFSDADDLRPNACSIVVYKHNRPVASVRLCTLDNTPGLDGFDDIPARRIFPEAVAGLLTSVEQPGRITEINRLVRHPDFATDYQLVFLLYRLAAFVVEHQKADLGLSCVRRNHMPFYKRLGFEYVDGPRRYAGVKFETSLMAGPVWKLANVTHFTGAQADDHKTYRPLFEGATVPVSSAA